MFCRILAILTLVLGLSACGHVDISQVERGSFKGEVNLVWVGGNADSYLGDGEFLYVPVAGRALTFQRAGTRADGTPYPPITPEAFYTDGGSIPRAVQGFTGFNAWAYSPAYVVHDWIFVARKCLNDEAALVEAGQGDVITPEMRLITGMRFRESAQIMAATILSLLSADTAAQAQSAGVIASFTAGPRTHALWQKKGACTDSLPRAEELAALRPYTQPAPPAPAVLAPGTRLDRIAPRAAPRAAPAIAPAPPREIALPDDRRAVLLGSVPVGRLP